MVDEAVSWGLVFDDDGEGFVVDVDGRIFLWCGMMGLNVKVLDQGI